ncbi:hypothetical protein F183_A06330 [Bryobacterales bacterium F-183]|nr:hypothetical protein F183_A06330 [Bryobacterales bacterium F-183]
MSRRLLILGLVLLGACAKTPTASVRKNVEHYDLKGVVLRLRPEEKIAVIKHEQVKNAASGKVWMEPMTMDFPVPNASEFQQLKVGKTVEGRVNQDLDTLEYWLDQLR